MTLKLLESVKNGRFFAVDIQGSEGVREQKINLTLLIPDISSPYDINFTQATTGCKILPLISGLL